LYLKIDVEGAGCVSKTEDCGFKAVAAGLLIVCIIKEEGKAVRTSVGRSVCVNGNMVMTLLFGGAGAARVETREVVVGSGVADLGVEFDDGCEISEIVVEVANV
jgi:hypothetical protein